MRKLILILINVVFINVAFAQSYTEHLNKLNNFLQENRDRVFFIKNIEVKDGYLYIYESVRNEYQKISMKDIGGAVDDLSSSVNANCLSGTKCAFQSSINYNSDYLHFYVPDRTMRSKLVILLNDFISSYDKDFGISYVKPAGCISGNCENGTGYYVYADNTQYRGEWKNGKRTGKGTVTKMDGTEVLGKWENDAIAGKGTIKYPDKYAYEGAIKDNLASGEGTLSYKDDLGKVEYKGTFVNGLLNGKGTYYGLLKDTKYERKEETYTGNFKDGLYDGYGIYELTSHFPKAKVKGMDTKISDAGEWRKGKKYDAEKDSVYSLEDQAIFKIRIDSLKDKIIEVENLLIANYQHDIDLAKQKKYAELLGGKKWVGENSFLLPINYNFGDGMVRKVTAEFEMRQQVEFVAYGDHLDAKVSETITLPKSKKLTDGGYVLIDKYGTNQFGYIEYGSSGYVTSTYTTSMLNFNWPEFKLSYAPYSSSYADVNKMDIYKRDADCKDFIDKYMLLLVKCNFKFFTRQGRLALVATSNNGTVIDLDYEKTTAQLEIADRKDKLEDQIRALRKLIANKN